MEGGPTLAQVARALHRIAFSYWKVDPELYEVADWFFICLAAIAGEPSPEREIAVRITFGPGGGAVGRVKLARVLLRATLSDTLPIKFGCDQDRDDFVKVLRHYIADQKSQA